MWSPKTVEVFLEPGTLSRALPSSRDQRLIEADRLDLVVIDVFFWPLTEFTTTAAWSLGLVVAARTNFVDGHSRVAQAIRSSAEVDVIDRQPRVAVPGAACGSPTKLQCSPLGSKRTEDIVQPIA